MSFSSATRVRALVLWDVVLQHMQSSSAPVGLSIPVATQADVERDGEQLKRVKKGFGLGLKIAQAKGNGSSQGQNLALTVFCVPSSLDSGLSKSHIS